MEGTQQYGLSKLPEETTEVAKEGYLACMQDALICWHVTPVQAA